MKRYNWYVIAGIMLITLSALLYSMHYFLFHDSHHIFIYFVGDIAFVPIEVLLVTIIIHRMLNMREKKTMLEKLNMVIGAFFSEVGTSLLKQFGEFLTLQNTVSSRMLTIKDWSKIDFQDFKNNLKATDLSIDIKKGDLEQFRLSVLGKKEFLLRLLENPNLLEHDTFTDLLWAVTHLTEELAYRDSCTDLPETDLQHLTGDMKRAYILLVQEWLDYMQHLKQNYQYLFSLAVRMNPFNPTASPVIR
ncbi:MAG: hypothetical protein JXB48_13420 [Candidatus Latescibacteria bacterium]|nr:hypothetical protein [Candidatus Latescibacterota bacterium]